MERSDMKKRGFYSKIKGITEYLLFLLFAAMVVIVFINVIARFAFNNSLTASEEIARICFIWLVFIGATLALEEGEHIGIDLLINLLPRIGQKLAAIVANILLLAITALASIYGFILSKNNMNWPSPATGISFGAIGIILPICFTLMFFIVLRKTVLLFKK
jgi:TRAP-type C4-dicarboxylate transport system permease small subunit